jgi:dCMP deaminase
MERISFDEAMLNICNIIARRSTCCKNKVGALIVKDGRIISMGYNGNLPNIKHCETIDDCLRKGLSSGTQYEIGECQHAEQNAILFCAKHGVSTNDSVMYVSSSVCSLCAKAIVMAGIKKVIYIEDEYDGIRILEKNNIECIKMDI